MTRMESYPTSRQSQLSGSPVMKSIVMSFHLCEGIGRDWRLPYGLCRCDFDLMHTSHASTYFSTSTLIVSQWYFRVSNSWVFSMPKGPPRGHHDGAPLAQFVTSRVYKACLHNIRHPRTPSRARPKHQKTH